MHYSMCNKIPNNGQFFRERDQSSGFPVQLFYAAWLGCGVLNYMWNSLLSLVATAISFVRCSPISAIFLPKSMWLVAQ